MSTTNFQNGITPIVAEWLNDVDAHVYNQDADPHPQYTLDTTLAANSGSSLVGYTQGGVGSTTSTVQSKLRESVSVKDFGAVGDGVTDDSSAIQSAINAVYALGGGIVEFGSGTYIVGTTLVLYSKVILCGQGSSSTILKAKNALNAAVIQSYNYNALIGTDTWLIANGNQYSFGLMRLKIDGNKTNQTSGSGVQFYGKRFRIDDVIITSCKEEGWHSESNLTIPGSPATNGDDMPEGLIRGLYVWECDSHGFVFRGQHDTYIESLFVGVCGGWGVRFETDIVAPTVYSGNCDSGFMHVYANTAGGIYIDSNSTHRGSFIISESNFGVGFESSGWQVLIGQLQLYTNCRTTGTYQAVISGSQCRFDSIHVKDTGNSKSGVSISGVENTANITAVGGGSTGCGVDVVGVYHQVNATIGGFSGVGGIGLRTGNGTQLQHSIITATLNTCVTGWNNASVGTFNTYNIAGYFGVGQTLFSGSGPNTNDQNETWNVKGNNNGTVVLSESRIRSVNAIDLNSTTQGSIVIPHGLVATPEWEDISVDYVYQNSNLSWVMSRPPFISSVDATNVTIKWKLSTAAGGADFADIIVSAKL